MPALAPKHRLLACALLALVMPTAAPAQAHDHAAMAASAPQSADAQRVVRTMQALFAAAERNDMAALDTLYAGDSLLVIEGAGINRGWKDYRDNHLGPELKEFKNFKYRPFEIEARVVGDVAWVTYRYAISADMGERKLDSVGRGTAILERRGAKWVVRLTQTGSRARRPNDPPMP
ncbi:MAG: nuclear transport factor 2 family protein [Gemmatimonadales bacterium]|nr:nuclear transport factor 2 family protein [Gemmatimonadota bacterium]MCL4214111.1 nuclear transport factor 2 family protein [Gemmatimonadales bacterium]